MMQKNYDNTETYIKAILHCWGHSEQEIQENSLTIVQIQSAKSKDLTIEFSTPVSSLGMVTLLSTQMYPFDLVFGFLVLYVTILLLFPTHFPCILFACSYLMLIISCLHSYFLLQTFFSFMCSLTVYA